MTTLRPTQAVEDTVVSHGGEVWHRDTQLAGLGEKLFMSVALPYLWGLPPAFDTLRRAMHGHPARSSTAHGL